MHIYTSFYSKFIYFVVPAFQKRQIQEIKTKALNFSEI